MPSVFISYVRQNSEAIDGLAAELRRHGVTVWLDREQIMPGMRWQDAIREAIAEGDYFLACFSAEYVARPLTYMNTEIGLAIEMLQQMPMNRVWFIPVLLSECEVPNRSIGGGQTLRDVQWEPLYRDWSRGINRILRAMNVPVTSVPTRAQEVQTLPDILKITKPIPLVLVLVPAGEFLMGSDPAKEKFASRHRQPQHKLVLPDFYIGKYPITNGQYAVFVQATGHEAPEHWKGGKIPSGKEDHPVVYISWSDSVAFCKWLSETTGRALRLLTEAEWEKAASWDADRKKKRIYPWGDTFDKNKCNTGESGIGETTTVGVYSSKGGDSPYGVADMAGNVWEWTSSLFNSYPYDPHDGREDLAVSDSRVLRGGSFIVNEWYARCADRNDLFPDHRDVFTGLRVGASPGLSAPGLRPSGTP